MKVILKCTYYHSKGVANPDDELNLKNNEAQSLLAQGLAVLPADADAESNTTSDETTPDSTKQDGSTPDGTTPSNSQ